jgi:hypothetical protein
MYKFSSRIGLQNQNVSIMILIANAVYNSVSPSNESEQNYFLKNSTMNIIIKHVFLDLQIFNNLRKK